MYELVCRRCGTHNDADATFCGDCGAFLEWEGERVENGSPTTTGAPATSALSTAAPATTAPATAAPTTTGPTVTGGAVTAEPRVEPATTPTAWGAPASDVPAVPGPPVVPGPPAPPGPPPPPSSGSDALRHRAESLVAPVRSAPPDRAVPGGGGVAPAGGATIPAAIAGSAGAPPAADPRGGVPPAAGQPAAVQPALPASRPKPPRARQAPSRRPEPGDVICGQCGEGNVATRKFCRRCGAPLVEAVAVAPLSWWQRFVGRFRKPARPARPVAAGARPPSVGGIGGARRNGARLVKQLLALAVVVVVVAFAAVPSLRAKITQAKKAIHPTYAMIPVRTAAATGAGSCPAVQVTGNNTVYWYTHSTTSAAQTLTVAFDPAFTRNLDKIGITPIAPSAATGGQALPGLSVISLGGTPAATAPARLALANPPKFQSFTVTAAHPTALQIQVVSSDPGAAPASCADTAFIFYSKD